MGKFLYVYWIGARLVTKIYGKIPACMLDRGKPCSYDFSFAEDGK